MPFGMKNSPATFQHLVNGLISNLDGCKAYIDYAIIYSEEWGQHLQTIRTFFDRLSDAKLTVNLAKSEFCHANLMFLGHIVGQGQVKPVEAKVEAISDFPVPTGKRQLMRFLGMAGYYRKFCNNFSVFAEPLTNLLSKKAKYVWTDDCQKSFDKLKAILRSAPVLLAPSFDKEFKLAVDAMLLYADDMDKNASTEAKMQRAMDQVSQSCDNYDLTISTEVVHQPAPGKPYNEPTITVNGQKLKVVDKFTYLGSTLSRAVHIDDEITARIAKASVAFGRLRANVWERNGIKLDTKLKVYKAVVLPTLLYACETWTVYQRHAKRLNHFHLSCLRKLLKIKWQDKIPDTEVLTKAGMQSMHTVLKLAQLRWTGHVIRMPDAQLPKKVFYGELQ